MTCKRMEVVGCFSMHTNTKIELITISLLHCQPALMDTHINCSTTWEYLQGNTRCMPKLCHVTNLVVICRWAQELRFYCTTTNHNRVMHFKTINRNIIQTAYDGMLHFSASDWRFVSCLKCNLKINFNI